MPTFRVSIEVIVLLSLLLGGCSKQATSQSPNSSDAPVLKIAVFADGRLTVDGEEATLQTLQESLRQLSTQHGVVWYYRENGHQEPPPIATEVVKAVIEEQLPIRLSSRPDYSDYVGADGRPVPE